MSYARFAEPCGKKGESDVYIFGHVSGGIECCACNLHDGGSVTFYSGRAMKAHLELHKASGHNIPARAWRHAREIAADEKRMEVESRKKFGPVFSKKWSDGAAARDEHRRKWLAIFEEKRIKAAKETK